jgi:hypothetical protein
MVKGKAVPANAIKAYVVKGSRGIAPLSHNSVPDWGEWLNSRRGRAGQDVLGKIKSLLYRGSNPGRSSPQSSHYTDHATPVPYKDG